MPPETVGSKINCDVCIFLSARLVPKPCWVDVTIMINVYRSHFGSRYTLGCCGHASLLLQARVLLPACWLLAKPTGNAVSLRVLPTLLVQAVSLMETGLSVHCVFWRGGT